MDLEIKNYWKLLEEKLTLWLEQGIKILPNLVGAILILVVFFLIALLVRNMIGRVLKRFRINRAVEQLSQKVIFITVFTVGIFLALGILQLDKTVTSLLAGAGVIGLALGFAFQEIASNFVSGILIAFTEPYQLGDIIEIDDYVGEVTDIRIRTTSVTTFQGLEAIIPNKTMFTSDFINYTTTPQRRIDLEVGISYGEDLESIEQVVKDALQSIEERIKHRDIEFYYKEFGGSSINFEARMWIDYPANQAFLKARHQMIINIKKAFDEKDINIPFPIRTLDFGIKGGEKLNTVMKESSLFNNGADTHEQPS